MGYEENRRFSGQQESRLLEIMRKRGKSPSPTLNDEILAELRQIRWLMERDRWGLNTPLARKIIRESADD